MSAMRRREGSKGIDRLVLGLDLLQDVRLDGAPEQPPIEAAASGGGEVHGEHGGRRAADGHRDGGAFEVEAVVEADHVLDGIDGHAALADLGHCAGLVGVEAVEGQRVERSGEARGAAALPQEVEAPVRGLREAEAGEHTDGVLVGPAGGVRALGVWECAGDVLLVKVADDLRQAGVLRRQAQDGHPQVAGGLAGDGHAAIARGGAAVEDAVLLLVAVAGGPVVAVPLPDGRKAVAVLLGLCGVLGHLPDLPLHLAVVGLVGVHHRAEIGPAGGGNGLGQGRSVGARTLGAERQAGALSDDLEETGDAGVAVLLGLGQDKGLVLLEQVLDAASAGLRLGVVALVHHDDVGAGQERLLLQLDVRAVVGGHAEEGAVHVGGDAKVVLAKADGLDEDEGEAGGTEGVDESGQGLFGRVSGAQADGAEVDAGRVAVEHPQPVAERGVEREDGDGAVAGLEEAVEELIDQGALACAAAPVDAPDRGRLLRLGRADAVGAVVAELDLREAARQGSGGEAVDGGTLAVGGGLGAADHVADGLAELEGRAVDLRHAHALQRGDLPGQDGAAAAAEEGNVADALSPLLLQELADEAHVAAVVGAQRDGRCVLLDGGLHDVVDALVEADVDGLDALAPQESGDGRCGDVMAVADGGGDDEAGTALRHAGSGRGWCALDRGHRPSSATLLAAYAGRASIAHKGDALQPRARDALPTPLGVC